MPVTFRTMPWVDNTVLAYATLVGFLQGGVPGYAIATGKVPPIPMPSALALVVVAAAILAGAIGSAGRTAWGRTLLVAALAAQFIAHASFFAFLFLEHSGTPLKSADLIAVAFMVGHLALIAVLLVFMHRPVRTKPAPA